MNRNKTKKIAAKFSMLCYIENLEKEAKTLIPKFLAPLSIQDRIEIAKEQLSNAFASPSSLIVGNQKLPKIEGFNCTWIQNKDFSFTAQFTFASSEEKKVMRLIQKYGGQIINPDATMNQFQIEETNQSGKQYNVELANEIIQHRH